MNTKLKLIAKRVLPVIGGSIFGYLYYYFIGCRTGSCPITSNPFVSVLYGALIGFVFALPERKKVDKNN